MLLRVNTTSHVADRLPGQRLQSFGLDERDLQDVLFRSLDRLLPDDELMLVMQSRRWQEEPDLLALDADGTLYIFELKAWEAESKNLLQVLRYGQIFGQYDYAKLARLYEKTPESNQALIEAHSAKFDVSLGEQEFNAKQVFVVMTNGLDVKTREAVRYWRSHGLDVRTWIYRVYRGDQGEMLLDLLPFRVEDDPYEDIAEGYYIFNTNFKNNPRDDQDMLEGRKAAAFFDPWKYKVERLSRGDTVFLYRTGTGIVAMGQASGEVQKRAYHDDGRHEDQEYYTRLRNFRLVEPPVPAAEVKEVSGTNHSFRGTMFGINMEAGRRLSQHIIDTRFS